LWYYATSIKKVYILEILKTKIPCARLYTSALSLEVLHGFGTWFSLYRRKFWVFENEVFERYF
jgi:hypothetical protein